MREARWVEDKVGVAARGETDTWHHLQGRLHLPLHSSGCNGRQYSCWGDGHAEVRQGLPSHLGLSGLLQMGSGARGQCGRRTLAGVTPPPLCLIRSCHPERCGHSRSPLSSRAPTGLWTLPSYFLFEEALLEIKIIKLGSCHHLHPPCCSTCFHF